MSLKETIFNLLPTSLGYSLLYRIQSKRKNKTFLDVEKEMDRKYKKVFGNTINWDNPTTYNEKLQVAKIYGSTQIKTRLTDKLQVREWVKSTLKSEACHFVPIIATLDSIEQINTKKLPNRFIIKMNNDSGSVVICDEDNPLTNEWISKYKNYYQKRNYAYHGYEMQYQHIKPKIIIEKYMGDSIRDYKFACFNGKVVSCRVDFDRFKNHTRNFYDKNWNLLPYNKGEFNNNPSKIEKPKNYKKMWKIAEKLSTHFDQVRVDLYEIDGIIYFGEMTFTNGSGFEMFHPSEMDYIFGKMWKLDMKKITKRRHKLLSTKAKLGDEELYK